MDAPAHSNSLRDTWTVSVARLRERLRVVAGEIVQSVNPDAEHAWLVAAELNLYRDTTRNSPWLLVPGAFLMSEATAEWIAWPTRMAWSVCVAAVAILALFVGRYMDAREASMPVRLRAAVSVAVSAAYALAWASMSVFLQAPGNDMNQMVLVLVLACSIAATTFIAAPHPATAVVCLAIYSAFLIAPVGLSGSPYAGLRTAMCAMYILMMAGQLVAVYGTTKKMLSLEHERSRLVDGLQQAKADSDRERARAAAAGRTRSQFLSNMNHELRTPMNAILGFSELIQHKSFGAQVDKYAEYAEIIHNSGRHLLSLIDDMLDLAKIEGGKLSLRESTLDMRAIIADALDVHESSASVTNIALTVQIARGFPQIHADDRAIRQILANLLSNSIKFTPSGGSIVVFAHVEADGRPAFGVEDTGIGIAEEDQATAFERFGKGRPDVATMEQGTGLGLAIVKGFAEALEGSVCLKSSPGQGTRVTVYLPASRAQSTRMSEQATG